MYTVPQQSATTKYLERNNLGSEKKKHREWTTKSHKSVDVRGERKQQCGSKCKKGHFGSGKERGD